MTPAFRSGLQAAIIGFAIRFRGIVIALACVLLAYGVYALGRAKYDVFPEFAPPQVGIQTEAVGLTPEQVEVLVTRPIENAINGVPGVQTLRSTSIQGLSVVTVFFDPSSDIYRDRQVVPAPLAIAAPHRPPGGQPPPTLPLPPAASIVRGAGFIDTKNQRIVSQTEGQSLTADDIARTVLLSQGAASVTLGNVADVVEAPEPPIGGAAIQGKPGVILNVSEQYGANTIEVTKGVEAA